MFTAWIVLLTHSNELCSEVMLRTKVVIISSVQCIIFHWFHLPHQEFQAVFMKLVAYERWPPKYPLDVNSCQILLSHCWLWLAGFICCCWFFSLFILFLVFVGFVFEQLSDVTSYKTTLCQSSWNNIAVAPCVWTTVWCYHTQNYIVSAFMKPYNSCTMAHKLHKSHFVPSSRSVS